jgi:hypothetical protein
MKIKLNSAAMVLSAVMALGCFVNAIRAQQSNTTGHANDFSSVEYFDAPHQSQMKSRLSGAEARPLAGGLLVIQNLKLEIFDTNGAPEVVIKAPHCVYNTQSGEANSPGHLWLETGDGDSHVEGDGFLWRQSSSLLTISNHVRTVIEKISETKAGL